MGACCGGMKNSNQHKSLPEKNKAAAAAAAASNANNDQQQQHGNDVTSSTPAVDSAKPAGYGDDNHQPSGQSVDDAQFEAAITTLAESLECAPPVVLPEVAAAENHAKPEEQELLRIEEEPKVEVAADANVVFAEAPAAPAPESAAVDEATNGEDAGFEVVSEETVQLRISEDGDNEKLAAAAAAQQTPSAFQEEAQGSTDKQPVAADVSGTIEPQQVELKLSEEVYPPVEAQPEVTTEVRAADVTTEVVTEPSAVHVDNSSADVIHTTEVISLESVPQPPEPIHPAVDECSVHEDTNVTVPLEDIKPTDEPTTEKQPEIVVSASDDVSVQPPEVPVTEVKDELPVSESEPVAPNTSDQSDNSQLMTSSAGDDLVKYETEPNYEEQSAVSAGSEVESSVLVVSAVESEVRRDDSAVIDQPIAIPEPVEPSSTVAEDSTKSQEQESAGLVEVHEVSAQPSQEQPAVHDTTEQQQQQQELQPSEQSPSTETAASVDENNTSAAEVKPEQVEEISAVTTDQQIIPVEESSKADEHETPANDSSLSADAALASTSEHVDSAVAAGVPETVSELPPQEPVADLQQPVEVITTADGTVSEVNPAAGDLDLPEQPSTSGLETPATAADDGIQSETQHADPAATIVTDSGDLPPPEPELLSSPSEAAENIDSFPLPPPPPSEDSSELDHPATDDNSAAALSETAIVNGAASISPSDESTESSSTSGLNEESATAALKAAAAVDLIAVDGQHPSMEAAVASEA